MARIPDLGGKTPGRESENGLTEVQPVEVEPNIEHHISDADYWATDWRLRELNFERDARKAEHQKYMVALRKVCRDYANQALKEFPLGVAHWLAQEADNVCDDLPSQILKRPFEGIQTAALHQENSFELSREEWEKQSHNPAFVLKALSYAHDEGILPPGWVLRLLVEAGAKVYKTDGDTQFDEALGLTPKKIKEGRSGQRKTWIANLVAEGIDADLPAPEARELAIYEAEFVYGWDRYAPGTVQKYYEQFADERDGFGATFMHSLGWYGFGSDAVFPSIRLLFWRRKALKARLQAYRETEDTSLDRANRLHFVVEKTVRALCRNEPPVNEIGHFIESDF